MENTAKYTLVWTRSNTSRKADVFDHRKNPSAHRLSGASSKLPDKVVELRVEVRWELQV
jgi:hypothetical protein